MSQADKSHDGAPAPQFDNTALTDAMRAVAGNDTVESRRILYESLLKAWLLVATRAEPVEKPGWHDMRTDIAQSFSLEHDGNGMLVAVAFTDEEALRNWNPEVSWIVVQGRAFFQALAGSEVENVVINPYEPENPASQMIRPGGRVTRDEFAALAQGAFPRRGPAAG